MKLGHVYKKAVLREFTDDTFTVQKPREPWMGILGPVLIGEVGDILNIVFYNMASHPVSIHPHGVRYQKIHEGTCINILTKIQIKFLTHDHILYLSYSVY